MDTFLQKYLDQNTLNSLPQSVIDNLTKLEQQLSSQLPNDATFQDVMKDYGPHIVDLVKRVSDQLKGWQFSIGSVWNTLKFSIDIAKEVYQIIEAVQAKVVPPGTPPDEAEQKKLSFGVDMVYFIWATIDPLRGRLNWLPFEKTLEKWIVKKLALIGLQHAMSFFKANPQFAIFAEGNPVIVKAL